ncbi:MAG: DUF2306 domain-containing protein, partial [Bacteroidota bacterium]
FDLYTGWRLDIDFLISKQTVIYKAYYQIAFYSHIFSSLIILCSGIVLFSRSILKRFPKLHSWTGRSYVFLLLIIAAPSGLVMAFHANGGWLAKLAFIVLSILWWYFTWKGLRTALNKDFNSHKKWMIRSYALTLSAITLRLGQLALGYAFDFDYFMQYTFLAWFSMLFNLAIAELLIRKPFHRFKISKPILNPFRLKTKF